MMRLRLMAAFTGIALAIVAIARDDRVIAWVAMAVLAVAVVLGMILRRRGRQRPG